MHCQLVDYKPYKNNSDNYYVTFKYPNGKHVRKSCSEALSRFKLTEPVNDFTPDMMGYTSKKIESKKNAVIYHVDFKNKMLLKIS